MDLSTRYLGFDLDHPIVPGAGPLADDLDGVRRLEDAGAPLIALRSLFEEQIVGEQMALTRALDAGADASAESASCFPEPWALRFGPEEYLEHLARVKGAVGVPVVASLNGTTLGGWLDCAARIEQAGADALELNLYELATDPLESGAAVEERCVEIVRAVRRRVALPLAVKLSPFWSALPNVARRMVEAGAGALVLFNRFLQPDVDPDALEVRPTLTLSTPAELNLRLRWTAILHGRVEADLALSGGVHRGIDALKALECGAAVVQVVSSLLIHGPYHLRLLVDEVRRWLEDHELRTLAPLIGSMSHRRSPDPARFERANYARVLNAWSKP